MSEAGSTQPSHDSIADAVPRLSRARKLLFSAVLLATVYALAELISTTLYLAGILEPRSFLLCQPTGADITFDPVRGYRLPATPTRIARITGRTVEYDHTFRGDNLGFPDRSDFHPQRTDDALRFAVFGDSFTAGLFLDTAWPDRVEDLASEDGPPLELLNFACDGGGLANWWSVLTRLVEAEGYELDGVIFAVFWYNLDRRFTVWNFDDGRSYFARSAEWYPDTWPRSAADLQDRYTENAHLVDAATFEAALAGRWHPDLPRGRVPYLSRVLLNQLSNPRQLWWRTFAWLETSYPTLAARLGSRQPRTFRPDQRALIEDIGRALRDMDVPALVALVPLRESLLHYHPTRRVPDDVRRFADLLDARFVDGCAAFEGLSARETRACWFPCDGHWNQQGSDRFAELMAREIRAWDPQRAASLAATP